MTSEQNGTGGSLMALVPGLVLVGAGSASGAMSTTQQVGYSLGVAITGIVYFGAGDQDIGRAFQLS